MVVKQIEAEVHEGARHLLAGLEHVLFVQMPAARTHDQHGGFIAELVGLAFGADEIDAPRRGRRAG